MSTLRAQRKKCSSRYKAIPKAKALSLRHLEKVEFDFSGRVITAHPSKPLLLCHCHGWRSVRTERSCLNNDGSYQKHQKVNFNDGGLLPEHRQRKQHILGVSYRNGRLNVYPLDDNGIPGKAITTIDEGKRELTAFSCPDGKNIYVPYVKGTCLLQYAL